jgi:S-adenosylmethionine-diacylgycerolhomoserine-N-methlytransferase
MADRIGMYYSTYIAQIPDNVIMINSIAPNYYISFANKLYIFYQMMIAPLKSKINIKNHEDELNQFYENQATLYDAYRQNMLHGKKKLVPMIPFKEYDNLLILAGGTGDIIDHMPYINKLNRVVIVDLCEKLLNVAKKRNNLKNIEIIHHDATTYESKEKFDKIIITYSLTMIPDWKKTIEVIKNNLKDGGYVGVADFTTKSNNIFEKLNGYLFKNMFKTDGVILNEKHISILDKEFNRINCYIDYGGFPFIPFIKCPYYYGLWKKA